jgi:hypothetical protein
MIIRKYIWNILIISYDLPRVGKDITATIHNLPEGKKDVIIKWNSVKFDAPQK